MDTTVYERVSFRGKLIRFLVISRSPTIICKIKHGKLNQYSIIRMPDCFMDHACPTEERMAYEEARKKVIDSLKKYDDIEPFKTQTKNIIASIFF